MAAITPTTNLKLLKNPHNLSSQNQLTFANATAQYNYFNSLPKLEYDGCTYQRKDGVIMFLVVDGENYINGASLGDLINTLKLYGVMVLS